MWTAESVVAQLRRQGELWEPVPGLVALRGDALHLFRAVEARLAELARSEAFPEWRLPSGLALDTLARARYFDSFPHWLTAAAHLSDDSAALESVARAPDPAGAAARALEPAACALSPALCYHVYARLAGRAVDAVRMSAQGTCWRHEAEGARALARGWSFTMREMVHVGSPEEVARLVRDGMEWAARLAEELGLGHETVPASDPFFAPTARGRALLQRAKELKHELRLDIGAGESVAAASFNDHESFFGGCFDIRLADGRSAASGCVAFGVERWTLAFLVSHGPDAARWPELGAAPGSPRAKVRASAGTATRPESRAPATGASRGTVPLPPGASRGTVPPPPDASRGTVRRPPDAPLYVRHAAASDRGAWSVERDVAWERIDRERALGQPDLLGRLRDAALIESFHPVNLARLMRVCHDDVDAGVCFSLEAYEGFKHFHALRRYLDVVGFEPSITEEELVRIREGTRDRDVPPEGAIEALVGFMLSEHLASYFFRRLAERAREPVLADMLRLIAADEVRHAQSASDLIAKRIARDDSLVPRVLDAATSFRHYGSEVVGEVPVAMPGDEVAIRTFAGRIERLCGVRLVDHVKRNL
jgi:hypothetical protein